MSCSVWWSRPAEQKQPPVDCREAASLIHAGAPGKIRTCDTRFRKPLLYPLSYGGGTCGLACGKPSARPPVACWATRDVAILVVDGCAAPGGRPFLRWARVLTAPLKARGR